jgi:diacylglycerol kinase (ATP)
MQTGRRYPLIFNPRARSQRGRRALSFIMNHAPRFALYATSSVGEARELARKFADAGEPVVVAAGGDGTLNAVVCGLSGSPTALGVLPAGTMNVFARELGLASGDFPGALSVIDGGFVREVDLFLANGAPFVQMAGLGFDARVIEETTWERKKLLGPLAYLISAVRVLGDEPPQMRVVCGDGREEAGVCVLVGNGSHYGGQFKLFRKADNADSLLDVLVFKEAGYRAVFESLRGLARGGVDLSAGMVTYVQAKSLQVECAREVPLEADGELLGRVSRVEFAPAAKNLRVLAPEVPQATRFGDSVRAIKNWTKVLQADES